jgi:hypothetical protein
LEDSFPKSAKITLPISYKKVRKKFDKEAERKKLIEQGTSANEIDKNLEVKEQRHKSLSARARADALNFLIGSLLSQSAQIIYLVDMGLGELTPDIISEMPAYLRNRVVLADQNHKIRNTIFKFFYKPIIEELGPAWEKLRTKTNIDDSSINEHEHSICIIQEFLQTLTVAAKYDTEADLDLGLARSAMERLHKQVKLSESKALLSRIDGILNCYSTSKSVPGLMTRLQPSPQELLEELFNDAKLLSLSKSRYMLGIPSKAQIAILRLRKEITSFLSVKKNRQNLEKVRRIGNTATSVFNIEIPEIEVTKDSEFVPPIFPLTDFKPPCLATLRELPTVIPSDTEC